MQTATMHSDACSREPATSGETDSSMMSIATAGSDPSSLQQHAQVIDHRERESSREREHETVEVLV